MELETYYALDCAIIDFKSWDRLNLEAIRLSKLLTGKKAMTFKEADVYLLAPANLKPIQLELATTSLKTVIKTSEIKPEKATHYLTSINSKVVAPAVQLSENSNFLCKDIQLALMDKNKLMIELQAKADAEMKKNAGK